MLQLLAGFQVSQALYVVAKLGVATVLADRPRTVAETAAATGADADPLHRLIRTLTPMGIFRTDGDTVEATPLGLTLAEGRPGSVRDVALLWMETHYGPFTELLHTVARDTIGLRRPDGARTPADPRRVPHPPQDRSAC
jgi:hypothetical protein